jgi:Tol biopolymer transport system component
MYDRRHGFWLASRDGLELPFGPPVQLGIYRFGGPTLTADGLTIFFFGNRDIGGGWNIWVSHRESMDEAFGPEVKLKTPINSASFDGAPWISADGKTLYFTSSRPGGSGAEDIWVSNRIGCSPKAMTIGDDTGMP